MAMNYSHEKFSRSNGPHMGSERSFGVVFAVVFAVLGSWWAYQGNVDWGYSFLSVGVVFALIALIIPSVLHPLNVIWFRFGLLLHKIVSPLILGLIFFVTVTPIALVFKVLRKDPLNRRLSPEAKSYWIRRDPPGPDPQSMSNQF